MSRIIVGELNPALGALFFALRAHRKQVDKGGEAYLLHVVRVAMHFMQDTPAIVALLHDVIEDSEFGYDDLRAVGFSERVISSVRLLTREDKGGGLRCLHQPNCEKRGCRCDSGQVCGYQRPPRSFAEDRRRGRAREAAVAVSICGDCSYGCGSAARDGLRGFTSGGVDSQDWKGGIIRDE